MHEKRNDEVKKLLQALLPIRGGFFFSFQKHTSKDQTSLGTITFKTVSQISLQICIHSTPSEISEVSGPSDLKFT